MSQMVVKPRYLRHFATCHWLERIVKEEDGSYCKYNIHNVHHAENNVADFRLMVAIAGEYQHRRDDVMRQHLPMVLASLLNVNDQDLLQPESVLNERVPL